MSKNISEWIIEKVGNWLTKQHPPHRAYPILPIDKKGEYANLPWKVNVISDDEGKKMVWISEEMLDKKSDKIKLFFTSKAYAVVGASSNEKKYGNKVLRCYLQNRFKVYPVNPNEEKILELDCVKNVMELPSTVKSISIVTPPNVTKFIVDAAIEKGIKNIWMQPGAENASAIEKCHDHGINLIAQGHCILIELGFKE